MRRGVSPSSSREPVVSRPFPRTPQSACHLNEGTLTLGVVLSWGPGGPLFQQRCRGSVRFQALSSQALVLGGPHHVAWLSMGDRSAGRPQRLLLGLAQVEQPL